MFERRSLKWPITLAVLMIISLVCLTVGWVFLNVFSAIKSQQSAPIYWVLLTIGSTMFGCVVAGVVLYLVLSIQQINLNRRQSNFIDSVTHELKSPIASLKLYLQTLGRRNMADDQRQEFYRSMMTDVDRLDRLINHLLDAARLEHHRPETMALEPVRLDQLLLELAQDVQTQHGFPEEAFQLHLQPIEVIGRVGDLTLLFRNLIDNAAKYANQPALVRIFLESSDKPDWLRVRISDNGPGIPRPMRRRIFGRFVRLGSELERTTSGTGLGLYLVRSVIKRMKGRIRVEDLPNHTGTQFLVELPLASLVAPILSLST